LRLRHWHFKLPFLFSNVVGTVFMCHCSLIYIIPWTNNSGQSCRAICVTWSLVEVYKHINSKKSIFTSLIILGVNSIKEVAYTSCQSMVQKNYTVIYQFTLKLFLSRRCNIYLDAIGLAVNITSSRHNIFKVNWKKSLYNSIICVLVWSAIKLFIPLCEYW